jgi:hypothetical protein
MVPRGRISATSSRLGLDMFVTRFASASLLLPCLDLDLKCAASSRLEADNYFVTLVIYLCNYGILGSFTFVQAYHCKRPIHEAAQGTLRR